MYWRLSNFYDKSLEHFDKNLLVNVVFIIYEKCKKNYMILLILHFIYFSKNIT